MPKGKKVLVGGAFSIIHPGHVFFLSKAKSLGDHLTVVITNDDRLRKEGRFLVPARDRKKILEKLSMVDKVRIGKKGAIFRIVKEERPDIIALGYDQELKEDKIRKSLKELKAECKVVRIKQHLPGYSTGKLINKINKLK